MFMCFMTSGESVRIVNPCLFLEGELILINQTWSTLNRLIIKILDPTKSVEKLCLAPKHTDERMEFF